MRIYQSKEKYISLIINEMIPEVAKQKLDDYIDVFCEAVAFSVEETEQLILAGKKYGKKKFSAIFKLSEYLKAFL